MVSRVAVVLSVEVYSPVLTLFNNPCTSSKLKSFIFFVPTSPLKPVVAIPRDVPTISPMPITKPPCPVLKAKVPSAPNAIPVTSPALPPPKFTVPSSEL